MMMFGIRFFSTSAAIPFFTHIHHVKLQNKLKKLTAEYESAIAACGDVEENPKARAQVGKLRNDFQVIAEGVHELKDLEKQMKESAQNLEFEKAAALRDQIYELREVLAEEGDYKPWEKIRILSGEST